jgi:signal transduction histidine kinase/ActR/RegA family two-component response regulator
VTRAQAWAEWLRWRTLARRSSLTVKLTSITALVTAGVVFAAFWALSIQTRRSATELFAGQLARYQESLVGLQRQNLATLVASTSVFTQSPTLRSAMLTYRAESGLSGARADLVATVERELANLVTRAGRDLVLVTNDSGRVFASAATPGTQRPRRGADLSSLEAVRTALSPFTSADSGSLAVFRDGRNTYQLAVYPLVMDGFTIGALLLGERIDDRLVRLVRQGFDGDVLVTAGDTIVVGSVDDSDAALARALVQMNAQNGDAHTIGWNGRELVAAGLELGRTQSGERVQLWLLQPLDRTVNTLLAPLVGQFALYGTLAVLLAALGAAFATRALLRPFHEFVDYLRSAVAATRGQRFDAREQPVEVRALNASFNSLMDTVAAKQEELSHRSTELAAANAVLVDEIRQRERAEIALVERDERLRQSQKLEAIGTLAGGIAHDFNNLLTAVSGFTQLAMMSTPSDSAVTDDLQQVIEAADRAGMLTKQLLAFSRKQVLQPTVLDVGAVIRGVAPLFDRLLGEHIDVRVDAPDDLPRILADRGQLEQVIINLSINARDAMPKGGVLTIAAHADAPADADACIVIRVSDTGTGIPATVRDRIFEPFFTTKEPGKGTGLGLATVYGIVQQSGGLIDVHSTEGRGTTFSIRWPTVRDAATAFTPSESEAAWPRGSETVLLVEDDPYVRLLSRRTLETCGYRVLPAAEPQEALRIAADARIDIIVSDVVMPNMSGPDMVERFQATHPGTIAVFMSGYADDALRTNAALVGRAFLRKPFPPAALARVVREALDARHRLVEVGG